jgi:hypothetical protein
MTTRHRRQHYPPWVIVSVTVLTIAIALVAVPSVRHCLDRFLRHAVDRIVEQTLSELASELLATVAIAFAILHHVEMRAQAKRMDNVAKSMATRYIGDFPGHLDTIADLIRRSRARGTLDIISDCADYGSFFAPRSHQSVLYAVGDAISRGVIVRILACGPLQPITGNSQFHKLKFEELLCSKVGDREFGKYLHDYLEDLREDNKFREWLVGCATEEAKFAVFQKWLEINLRETEIEPEYAIDPTNVVQLKGYIEECLTKIAKNTSRTFSSGEGAQFKVLLLCRERFFEEWLRLTISFERLRNHRTSLFCWIKDSERDGEAVFSIANSGEKVRGLGFSTRDPQLIKVIAGTFESLWPKPCEDGSHTAVEIGRAIS